MQLFPILCLFLTFLARSSFGECGLNNSCSGHGLCANSFCECVDSWVLSDCSKSWSDFPLLYNGFKDTFLVCFILLSVAALWRFAVVLREKMSRKAYSGNRVDSVFDSHTLLLVLLVGAGVMRVILFVDPLSAEFVYSDAVNQFIFVAGSACLFTSFGVFVHFFVRIQAKVHLASLRTLRLLDALLIAFAVAILSTELAIVWSLGTPVCLYCTFYACTADLSAKLYNYIIIVYTVLLIALVSFYSVRTLQRQQLYLRSLKSNTIAPQPEASAAHDTARAMQSTSGHAHVDLSQQLSPREAKLVNVHTLHLPKATSTQADPDSTGRLAIASAPPSARGGRAHTQTNINASQPRVDSIQRLLRMIRVIQVIGAVSIVLVLGFTLFSPPYVDPPIYIVKETLFRFVEVAAAFFLLGIMGRTATTTAPQTHCSAEWASKQRNHPLP